MKLEKRKRKNKRKNQKKYRAFKRNEYIPIIRKLRYLVYSFKPPYKIKEKGTKGRTPTNPKNIAFALLIKSLFSLSYDNTHSFLVFLRNNSLFHMSKVPAATTIQGLVCKVPVKYLEMLIRFISRFVCKDKVRWTVAGDGTGIATKKYQRWLDIRTKKKGNRKTFIKLHGLITTDIEFPIFLSAKVTHGYKHDSPMLGPMLNSRNKNIEIGDVCLDSGYLSRKNVKLITKNGGMAIIKAKKNVKTRSKGVPEWRTMILYQRKDPESFNKRYHRRPVIEGVFGAFKERFTDIVRSVKRHNQKVEVLSRIVVWNSISWAYHTFQ